MSQAPIEAHGSRRKRPLEKAVDHVSVCVPDLEAGRHFYEDILGARASHFPNSSCTSYRCELQAHSRTHEFIRTHGAHYLPGLHGRPGGYARAHSFNAYQETNSCTQSDCPVLYLRVSAEADPGALARIIERFQNLNILPRRMIADWATTGILHVQVDIVGLPEDRVDLIAAKLNEVPCIVNAYWHR